MLKEMVRYGGPCGAAGSPGAAAGSPGAAAGSLGAAAVRGGGGTGGPVTTVVGSFHVKLPLPRKSR